MQGAEVMDHQLHQPAIKTFWDNLKVDERMRFLYEIRNSLTCT